MDEENSDSRHSYEACLRELRRGMGCTPGKIAQEPELCDALRTQRWRQFPNPAPEQLVERLRSLVESLEDPRLRGALLVALGFDPRYPQYSLTARRKAYNADLRTSTDPESRRMTVDNLRSVERRENRATELVSAMLQVAPPRETEPASPTSKETGSPLSTVAISHYCRFSDIGALNRQDTTRWVRAYTDPCARELEGSHQYHAENRSGLLRLEEMFGCAVVEQRDLLGSGLWYRLRIHRELTPADGLYSFGCRLHVSSNVKAHPYLSSTVRTDSMERLEFHLVFSPTFPPLRAWWFRSTVNGAVHIEPLPTEGRHLELHDGGNYLYRIFEDEDISSHTDYGVSWVWPNEGIKNSSANFPEINTAMENDG